LRLVSVLFAVGLGVALRGIDIAAAPLTVHGSADAYAGPGIALAWGVLRAPHEEATVALIRIVTDPRAFPVIGVAGIDPFTQREDWAYPPARSEGTLDVRISRGRFADLPRTEIRLFDAATASTDAPTLTVYFLGLPDTTPEFSDAAKLDAYLTARIARERAGLRSLPP
jgi:hypothetical protein